MSEDQALIGWKEIAKYMKVSLRTAKGKRKDLEKYGVIFSRHIGKPPRKYTCSFPNLISRYFVLKGEENE